MIATDPKISIGKPAARLQASTLLCTQDLALLARATTVQEVIAWLNNTLLPHVKASSCALLWGRAQPTIKFIPVYVTESYPKALLADSLRHSRFTLEAHIPLLSLWTEFESPIICRMENISPESRGYWHAHFQNSSFKNVAASGCHDVNGHYLTYLYITDTSALPDADVKSLLAIVLPLIHNVLGQVRRKKRQRQKNMVQGALTSREMEVLEWVKKGKTNPEIASILGVTFPTIKNHIQKIMIKLRVNNRAEAVGKAYGLSAQDTQLLDT